MLAFELRGRFDHFVVRYRREIARSFLLSLGVYGLVLASVDPAPFVHRIFGLGGQVQGPQSPDYRINVGDYPTQVGLLVLGGSSIRQLTPSPRAAEATVTKTCSVFPNAFFAASSAQTIADGEAILHALRGVRPKVVLVGLNVSRLSPERGLDIGSRNSQRLGLPIAPETASRSQTLSGWIVRRTDFFGQIRRLEATVGVSLYNSLLSRLNINARLSQSSGGVEGRQALLAAEVRRFPFKSSEMPPDSDIMTHRWRSFAMRLKKEGAMVIFVWTPRAPAIAIQAEIATKEAAIAAIAPVAPIIDASVALGLSDSDFQDAYHLNANGASKLWPYVVSEAAKFGMCEKLAAK